MNFRINGEKIARVLVSRWPVLAVLMLLSAFLFAGSVNKPYTFAPGDIISAGKINSNFDALAGGIVSNTNADTLAGHPVADFALASHSHANMVDSTGSYADPAWINSLSWSKLSGVPAAVNNAISAVAHDATLSGNGSSGSPLTVLTVPNGVVTTGSYADPAWITSLEASKLSGTVAFGILPVGSTASTVAVGNHTHTGLVQSVSAPLVFAAGALSIPAATASVNGYLSSADWNTFNAKAGLATANTFTANQSFSGALTVAGLSTMNGKLVANSISNKGTFSNIGNVSINGEISVTNLNGVVFSGAVYNGAIPMSGAGTRMMWFPNKAAFRAGYVSGTLWDDVTTGYFSTAFGYNTTASGQDSFAVGCASTASAVESMALGNTAIASGPQSTAMGNHTTASGLSSLAVCGYTTASGTGAVAMNNSTTASGYCSTALGILTTAQAYASVVIGRYNVISGNQLNWLDTEPLFVIGNGSSVSYTSNAFTVLKNGNTGINTAAPAYAFHVQALDNTTNTNIIAAVAQNQTTGVGIWYGGIRKIGMNATSDLSLDGKGNGNIILNASATGNVGVGTASPRYKLDVIGDIRATGSIYYGGNINMSDGAAYSKPDFVFENNYAPMTTEDVEAFVMANKHLPWVAAATDEKGGINMTRMNFQTLEAMENIQLQVIELNHELKTVKTQNASLKTENEMLKERLAAIERKLGL